MNRVVQREWLDELSPTDPHAVRSRRDLRRVNACMGNVRTVVRALLQTPFRTAPQRLVELGAGDGAFAVSVARSLAAKWPAVEIVLVDRQAVVAPEMRDRLQGLGWQVEAVQADVVEWLGDPSAGPCDIGMANLFLHQFATERLREILRLCTIKTRSFVACEPRRSTWSSACARLLWMIGCNHVTRYDALISIRAGFEGREISKLWPSVTGWHLQETYARPFSHLFQAWRTPDTPT